MFVSKKEFTNVNTTLKSIREDVQAQAEALRQKQDEHDRNIALIQETVETENARIQGPNTQVMKRIPGRRYLETQTLYSLEARLMMQSVSEKICSAS